MADDIEEILNRVLNDNRSISNETHEKHSYQYIESELDRRSKRREMWQKFKLSFIGTLATALVGGAAWAGKVILDALHKGTHP